MNLKDVARFAEVSARAADRTQGDENTRKAARSIMAQMEQEHPGIARAAERAERAMQDPFAGAAAQPQQGQSLKDVLTGIAAGAATKFAAGFGDELLDEAKRMNPLARNEVAVKRHDCSPGEACVEVRFRVRDWSSVRRRVVGELEDAAEG